MKILSVRKQPSEANRILAYFLQTWKGISSKIYEDCILNSVNASNPLPDWYILVNENEEIIGCAGLITNDFISRMDLYTWLCTLFIEENYRGNNYAELLINHIKSDAKNMGFQELNLCTDHIGYNEKFGFTYVGQGYRPDFLKA